MKPIVYISGHLDLTQDEFDRYYGLYIHQYIENKWEFVLGDAPGCDTMAQRRLRAWGATATVYHMLSSPRYNAGFPTRGGFQSDLDRDQQMTAASDMDLLWIRHGRESSGTAQNLMRREGRSSLHGLCSVCRGGFLRDVHHIERFEIDGIETTVSLANTRGCNHCEEVTVTCESLARGELIAAQRALLDGITPARAKYARKACGKSRGEVGALLGVDPSTVTAWEDGTVPIPDVLRPLLIGLVCCDLRPDNCPGCTRE